MNLPNRITLLRLILTPVFIFFYLADFIPYGKLVACIVFIIACLTDYVDGHLARKLNLCTVFGNFFDTVTDKLLTISGIIVLAGYPVLANGGTASTIISPVWLGIVAAVLIIGRELMVMALKALASARGIVIKADMFGKVKATMQFITVSYYIFYAFMVEEFYSVIGTVANTILGVIGYVLLAITVILTILSAINYIVKNKAVFKEEKTEKAE